MKKIYWCILFAMTYLSTLSSAMHVGMGRSEITPPVGTPSAGYERDEVMQGVHDPLLATALFIDTKDKQLVFCSVDHLGFTHKMVEAIRSDEKLLGYEIYIGSSHTHAGGGAYLDIPGLGEMLAGPFDAKITTLYVEQTKKAIFQALENPVAAKIGIGYGKAEKCTHYRGSYPQEFLPQEEITLIKITSLDDEPLAALFNFPLHPTTLAGSNLEFSADFVGATRKELRELLGENLHALYFNGAQAELIPIADKQGFAECEQLGKMLGDTIYTLWQETPTHKELKVATQKLAYQFKPQPSPFGITPPIDSYTSEMNLIIFNDKHAFLTMPGELSCVYDEKLKAYGKELGFANVSILGLTNDAHGYILTPEAWEAKTLESELSFGGKSYGTDIEEKAKHLLIEYFSPSSLN